ncbi:MAG TPA: TQO small subunit DoxD [Niabella sp.]|nr:TQO small subunit DoxD [Niabella sp.]
MKLTYKATPANPAGLFTLALRWVIGWTYFSAFWRRLVLENKLIPNEAGYIGEKFNHFLPNALGIQPLIEYLVSHPETLQATMIAFTIIEAIVGLLLMLGLFTRLMSIGVMLLALGILLGSGWLGTTCLDEWQIGVLGIAGGFTIFLGGSSIFSLDHYLAQKKHPISQKKWFTWAGSGTLPVGRQRLLVLIISLLIAALTLFTNQYFHGGVWGKLHNKSVKPKVEISNIRYIDRELSLQLFRTEGADVYGSFLIGIAILNEQGDIIQSLGQKELSQLSPRKIRNHFVAKIKPGEHSLILPLGAKADLLIPAKGLNAYQKYIVRLTDISGITWEAGFKID